METKERRTPDIIPEEIEWGTPAAYEAVKKELLANEGAIKSLQDAWLEEKAKREKLESDLSALREAAKKMLGYKTDGGSGMSGGSQMREAWENLEKAITVASDVSR